tara:strand:- start:23 stop:463 length:441 start_codon:yes stop_codon:yes gene_type:complete
MTTTIVAEIHDKRIYSWYWCPLLHKHEDQKFVFWGTSQFSYENGNVEWAHTFQDALQFWNKRGDSDQIVITNQHAVPTYKFMTLVPKIGTRNEMIIPKWQNQEDTETERPNTFACHATRYKGENEKDFILKNDPKIRHISSMYYVR